MCLILVLGCTAAVKIKAAATGKVTVNYTLTRISGSASNQFAVWIEDEAGKYIRTLFVTNYTARRQGWKARQQSLVTWVKAADVKNLPKEDVDAMSSATPQSGKLSVVWDLKDAAGKPVPAGVYVYRVEGCLLRENNVLWTGKIKVGGARAISHQTTASYYPEGAAKLGKTLISDVSAAYEPAQ
ncbi:MAG: DUF2271 domain-containing protein [Candidatus Latescibacter sp.]|nr:DUF2271 domain-containing protein [Candidatus Latescibacter sp.]